MLAQTFFRVEEPADWLRWIVICATLLAAGWVLGTMIVAAHYKVPPRPIRAAGLSYLGYLTGAVFYVHARLGHPFVTWLFVVYAAATAFALATAVWLFLYYRPARRKERHEAKSTRIAADLLGEAKRQRKGAKP